jgi:hypothetical protein
VGVSVITWVVSSFWWVSAVSVPIFGAVPAICGGQEQFQLLGAIFRWVLFRVICCGF